MRNLKDIADLVSNFSKKKEVWAEVWGEVERGVEVEKRDGKLFSVETYEETVSSARVIRSGKAGLSYASSLKEDSLKRALERAYELSAFSQEEAVVPEENTDLLKNTDVPSNETKRIEVEKLIEFVERAERAAHEFSDKVKRVEKVKVGFSENTLVLAQSHGFFGRFGSEGFEFFVSVVAEDGGDSRTAWQWKWAKDISEVDPVKLAQEASLRAVELLSSKPSASRKVCVLFPPFVAVSLLETLAFSFFGNEVLKGRSRLAKKLGEKVFSEKLTVVDDGTLPNAKETRPFDDEGMPQKKTVLVKEGVVSSFVYDLLWAKRAGTVSTGNSRRPSFKLPPSVSFTNLYIVPTKTKRQELLSSDGSVFEVYEVLGWHTVDPVSGEFSVGVSGILYEGGKKTPLSKMALSGNLFDLFKKVMGVGEDLEWYGEVGSPSILTEPLDLSG